MTTEKHNTAGRAPHTAAPDTRDALESALCSARDTLHNILEFTPDAITISDTTGMITEYSRATLTTHGIPSREKMIGRNIFEFFPVREHGKAQRALKNLLLHGSFHNMEIMCLRDNGEEFPAEISAGLIRNTAGAPVSFLGITKDISDRKAAQDALRESVNKYRALIETTGTGYLITDGTGTVLDANSEYLRLTGFVSPHQITGRDMSDWTAPHDIRRAREAFGNCATTGFIRNLEIDYVSRNGTVIPVEINAKAVQTDEGLRILSLCRDITERRDAEQALRRSEEQFRLLFENTRDAIFWADPRTGLITNCNKGAEDLLEMPRQEIIGLHQTMLHPPDRRDHYVSLFKRHVSDRAALDSEAEVITKSGRVIPVFISASTTEIQGRAIHQGVFRDMTELRNAQRDKEGLIEMLYQSQKMEAIGQLAGGMAHDFNNILAVMIGNSELALRRVPPDDPNHDRIGKIIRVGRRARDLTMKLLTFARKEKLQVRNVSPNDIVREMLDMLERSITKKVTFVTRFHDDVSPVAVDMNQILQALMNLCINACDAMPEAGTLTIATSNVLLGRDFCHTRPELEPGPYSLIEIHDTGPGIPEEFRDKIFEPFFTTKRKGKGTGLGLSVALGVMQSHHGWVELDSLPGKGTTARVYLPVASGALSGEDPAPGHAPQVRAPRTILVIDDDADFREMITEMLRVQGHEVLAASGGHDGVDVFRRRGADVDLVLLDMKMPGLDGADVFHRLREIRDDVKVVLCSGFSSEGRAGSVLAHGAAAFIQKPFELSELQTILARVL